MWAKLETMEKFHQKQSALDIYGLPMGLECILKQIISNTKEDHALFRQGFNSNLVTPAIKALYQGHKKGVQKKSWKCPNSSFQQ